MSRQIDSSKQGLHAYYICNACADEKKLTTKYPTGGNTLAQVDCGYCGKKDSFCTPIVDFKQSGDKTWD